MSLKENQVTGIGGASGSALSAPQLIDGELRQVILHPCSLCGDVLSDVDQNGQQIHMRQVFNKFVCEACFQRLAHEFGVVCFDPPSQEGE